MKKLVTILAAFILIFGLVLAGSSVDNFGTQIAVSLCGLGLMWAGGAWLISIYRSGS